MPRPRNKELPGMERKGIPELEEIGIEIGDIDDQSWKLRERREFLVKKGLEEMHKHSLTNYKVEGITMTLEPGVEKLKVKKDNAKQESDAA